MIMEEVYAFLKACETYYLATVDGDQPRVRPFGTIDLFEGNLYSQTGKSKDVSQQMHANPKIELCGMADEGTWIRVTAQAVQDDRMEARQHMLDANPALKRMYAADDGNCEVVYLRNAAAQFCSFTAPPRIVQF